METTPVTLSTRTAKVRTANTGVSKTRKAPPKSDPEKAKSTAPRKRKTLTKKAAPVTASHVDVSQMIATAAYYLAERRHFVPGYEWQDWLEAERSILERLSQLHSDT